MRRPARALGAATLALALGVTGTPAAASAAAERAPVVRAPDVAHAPVVAPALAMAAARAGCAVPTGVYIQDIPWPQRLLDPSRTWPVSRGAGATVAVLGTGVDAQNPQFGPGQVVAGPDLVSGQSTTSDCDGRGTFAAGIIAGQARGTTTFTGIAPDASVLSIRYTQTTSEGKTDADPTLLAAAIQSAVAAKVEVICIVVPTTTDSPALQSAVAAAVQANIVVVAPAATAQFNTQNGTAYPAPDPHVLAVAPIGADGAPASGVSGDYIDLAAPGKGLVSTSAGSGGKSAHVWPVDDPTFAAAYVAGVVALLRSRRPGLTVDQVISRLERTASHTAAGGRDARLGWGVVNPYTAVTAEGVDTTATPPPPVAQLVAPATSVPGSGPANQAAGAVAILILAAAAGVVIGVFVVHRGRRRGWRPRSAATVR